VYVVAGAFVYDVAVGAVYVDVAGAAYVVTGWLLAGAAPVLRAAFTASIPS